MKDLSHLFFQAAKVGRRINKRILVVFFWGPNFGFCCNAWKDLLAYNLQLLLLLCCGRLVHPIATEHLQHMSKLWSSVPIVSEHLCQKLSSITKELALHATLPNLLGLDWLATPFPTDCHLVQLLDQSMEMPVSFPFFLPSSMHLNLPLSGYLKNTNCKITNARTSLICYSMTVLEYLFVAPNHRKWRSTVVLTSWVAWTATEAKPLVFHNNFDFLDPSKKQKTMDEVLAQKVVGLPCTPFGKGHVNEHYPHNLRLLVCLFFISVSLWMLWIVALLDLIRFFPLLWNQGIPCAYYWV